MLKFQSATKEHKGVHMKVKVFSSSDQQALEQEINRWLESARPVEIIDKQLNVLDAICQKEGYGRYIQFTILIWYK